MVWAFSPAGDRFTGFYWNEGQTGQAEGMISGRRTSRDVGQCPQWVKAASGVEGQVAQDLAGSGRVRLYGVNFDSDSDQIRPESAPMLEHIAAVLKAHPDWRLAVEGHTDSTSTPEHNQTLSERRAAAVSAWLTAHAVEAARLSAKGFGQTRPVADNDSELGRSQNRRVELARQ
jgi:outer membrane protein OmpA-like peptidoglycan-associated protein